MYSFRTVQMNLHLIFTGWIPACNRIKWDQNVLCIDFSLSNFGSRIERTPILPCHQPYAHIQLCCQCVCRHTAIDLQIQQEPQDFFYSNWPDKLIFQVLCVAGLLDFQRSAITMKTGVICKSSFTLFVVIGNNLACRPHHSLLLPVEVSHMKIVPLVSMKWKIEVEIRSALTLNLKILRLRGLQTLLSCFFFLFHQQKYVLS